MHMEYRSSIGTILELRYSGVRQNVKVILLVFSAFFNIEGWGQDRSSIWVVPSAKSRKYSCFGKKKFQDFINKNFVHELN